MKKDSTYKELLSAIGGILDAAGQKAVYAVNVNLVAANWEIGRHIVEFEQAGNERAEYGTVLLARH